ncbi:MAG: methyl-accepting chemotaxis protein [Lysinibacillus sp.]
MKVGLKLNLSFFAITFLLLISTVISVMNLNSIESKTEEALDNRVEQILYVDEIRVNLGMQGLYARALMLQQTEQNKTSLIEAAEKLDQSIVEIEKLANTEVMKQHIEKIKVHNNDFNASLEKVLTAVENKELNAAEAIVTGELQSANVGILTVAGEMLEFQNEQLKIIKTETAGAVSLSKNVAFIVLAISAIIAIVLIFVVRSIITKPLGRVMVAATAISNSDLTQEDLKMTAKDEIGQLGNIFDEMKHNLRSLIGNVQGNAESLSAAAEELSASTEEVTATTEDVTNQVTSAAEMATGSMRAAAESATAMDETAQGVQRIAEASTALHSASIDASATASNGKGIVESAKEQMNVINDSTATVNEVVQKLAKQTAEIESITKAITDITEQTNLLALNASIEAARAGEHGKGFAVVADEVKKLAEESKASAQSIVALTMEIQSDTSNVEKAVSNALGSVQDGVKIITEAGDSFEEIVGAVNDMTTQIQEVSATAEQLSASAEEVSASIAEIASGANVASDGLTSIAAAMEEQTATMQEVSGVAVSLSDSASELQAEIQKFRV